MHPTDIKAGKNLKDKIFLWISLQQVEHYNLEKSEEYPLFARDISFGSHVGDI